MVSFDNDKVDIYIEEPADRPKTVFS